MQKALSNATTACRCDSLWSITFTEHHYSKQFEQFAIYVIRLPTTHHLFQRHQPAKKRCKIWQLYPSWAVFSCQKKRWMVANCCNTYKVQHKVFENHRKSLIQASYVFIMSGQKWSILARNENLKLEGQTVLPDRSMLMGQKLKKMPKFKCHILTNFQTVYSILSCRSYLDFNQKGSDVMGNLYLSSF